MLHVSASPHIRDNVTTQRIMLHVIIALMPTVIASGFIFGYRAPLLFAISAAACAGFEVLSRIAMKRNRRRRFVSCCDGPASCASLPVETPSGSFIGAFMAVVFVKQMFGGLEATLPIRPSRRELFSLYLLLDRFQNSRSSPLRCNGHARSGL